MSNYQWPLTLDADRSVEKWPLKTDVTSNSKVINACYDLQGRRSIEIDNCQTLIKSASLVVRTWNFPHFVELIIVNKYTD